MTVVSFETLPGRCYNRSGNCVEYEMKFCPKCGVKCPDNARFCPECGYRFPAELVVDDAAGGAPAASAPTVEAPEADVPKADAPVAQRPTAAQLEAVAMEAAQAAAAEAARLASTADASGSGKGKGKGKGVVEESTDDWGGEGTAGNETGGFSETAWFMAAVKPEELAEQASADELEGKYKRDQSLSEEERQKYSLNRKGSPKGGKK